MPIIRLHHSPRARTNIPMSLRAAYALRKMTSAQYKSMPWTSGTGITTELCVFPKNGRLIDGSAYWRVSMASVPESGPFSLLPEYDRFITLVQGHGFHLKGNMGTDIQIKYGSIYPFSGAEQIQCELLGGHCLDLNLIYRRDKIKGNLTLIDQYKPIRATITTQSSREAIMVICLGGKVTARAHGQRTNSMVPYDSVYFSTSDGQGTLFLNSQANSRLAVIGIEGIE